MSLYLSLRFTSTHTTCAVERSRSLSPSQCLLFFVYFLARFVARLYFFPLRHVYYSSVYLQEKQIQVPFVLFLNTLLYILLAMNFYWFTVSARLKA